MIVNPLNEQLDKIVANSQSEKSEHQESQNRQCVAGDKLNKVQNQSTLDYYVAEDQDCKSSMPMIEAPSLEKKYKNIRTLEPLDRRESYIHDEQPLSAGLANKRDMNRQIRTTKIVQSGDTTVQRAVEHLPIMGNSSKDEFLSPYGGVQGNASLQVMIQNSNASTPLNHNQRHGGMVKKQLQIQSDQIKLPEMQRDSQVSQSQKRQIKLKEFNPNQYATARVASSSLEYEDQCIHQNKVAFTQNAQTGKTAQIKRKCSQDSQISGSEYIAHGGDSLDPNSKRRGHQHISLKHQSNRKISQPQLSLDYQHNQDDNKQSSVFVASKTHRSPKGDRVRHRAEQNKSKTIENYKEDQHYIDNSSQSNLQNEKLRARNHRKRRNNLRNDGTTSLTVEDENLHRNPLSSNHNEHGGSEIDTSPPPIVKEAAISKRRKFILKRKQMIARQKAQAAQDGDQSSKKSSSHHNTRRTERRQNRRLQQSKEISHDKLQTSHKEQSMKTAEIGGADLIQVKSNVQLSEIDEKTIESQIDSPDKKLSRKFDETQDKSDIKVADHQKYKNLSDKKIEIPPVLSESKKLEKSSVMNTNRNAHIETSRQNQKDLKILNKCFNRSLERMQENYQGSAFLHNKDGGDSRSGTARTNQFWQSPRVNGTGTSLFANNNNFSEMTSNRLEQQQQAYGDAENPNLYNRSLINKINGEFGDQDYTKRQTELAFPSNIMPMNSNSQQVTSPTKPRTSVGISRDQIRPPVKIEGSNNYRHVEDFGKHIKVLRDNLQTQQNAKRPIQSNQSPMKAMDLIGSFHSAQASNGKQFNQSQVVQSPNQIMRQNNSLQGAAQSTNGSYFSQNQNSFTQNDTKHQNTLRNSVQSPAKQHQFRKQLKLQHEGQQEHHHLVLIESAPSVESNNDSRGKGEITLKAVKLSNIVNGQRSSGAGEHMVYPKGVTVNPLETIEPTRQESTGNQAYGGEQGAALQDSQMKLKIITTQIPQSLLISNHAQSKTIDAVGFRGGQGSSERADHPLQLAFTTRNNQHVIFSHQLSHKGAGPQVKGVVGNQGTFVNGFLVPSNQYKAGRNTGQTSSMPPSLTAINVQQTQLMAREAHQNSQFHSGAYNAGAKSILPQQAPVQNRKVVKKKSSAHNVSNQQQMKIARRQIQFYQKRLAEVHLPARTPKSSFVTRRLLFKRRMRLQDQNLLIFYFDGVIGELCSKNSSFGIFKVRHGVWQSLRKLSCKYQIAIVLPYVKQRAKVISCYFDKFQGCPIDAVYCVRSSYIKEHSDLRFIDYRQIYEDFDLMVEEKLIDKCMIIAPRTKEVSSYHLQNPSETVYHPRLWANEKNQPEENLEENKLMQMYLMNQELQMSSRLDIFHFQGCPANLSTLLEPPKRKVNYLANDEEALSPSTPKKNTAEKEKQTATQANKIAVDLGQQQKPVTLFVPHTKNITTSMNSFLPICKIIEDLATLDEHNKAQREANPLLSGIGSIRDSYESSQGPKPGSNHSVCSPNQQTSNIISMHNCPPLISPKSGAAKQQNNVKQELQPFSLIEAFYAFKTMLVGASCFIYSSLLKTLFAIETKKVQTFLYKDSMVGRVLLEKAEIKKCYQYTQQKHAQTDRSAPTQSSHYVQMKTQNEYLKRYIQEYTNAYYSKVKETMDEAKIMRMTAYFMNQFSQRLVEDKNKKPNQHLREMFHKEINYDEDLPSRNINLFKNHRFLIMVKSTGLGHDGDNEETSKGPAMETIDMQKIMGSAYFRQLEHFRQGMPQNNKSGPPEILPPEIVRILFKQRHSDATDWFTKKAYSKPIQLIEKQQMILERKEMILRGEQDKANQISSHQPSTSTKNQDNIASHTLPPFQRSITLDKDRINQGGGRENVFLQDNQHNSTSNKKKDNSNRQARSNSPTKQQRNTISRGKTINHTEKVTR